MADSPAKLYFSLMRVIRQRFDAMDVHTRRTEISYVAAESVAYNARKIVEGIAFACLVALEHGLAAVPKDAKGKWNAEKIFLSLQKKGLGVLPNPGESRQATPAEMQKTGAIMIVEDQPSKRLNHTELVAIYQRLHDWAHELNPYLYTTHDAFLRRNLKTLMRDVVSLSEFISNHSISIRGQGFYCVLKDGNGQTQVISFQGRAR